MATSRSRLRPRYEDAILRRAQQGILRDLDENAQTLAQEYEAAITALDAA